MANQESIHAKIANALELISALCRPKGSAGSREWSMSIPARPDYDPDLVLSDALYSAKNEITDLERQLEDMQLTLSGSAGTTLGADDYAELIALRQQLAEKDTRIANQQAKIDELSQKLDDCADLEQQLAVSKQNEEYAWKNTHEIEKDRQRLQGIMAVVEPIKLANNIAFNKLSMRNDDLEQQNKELLADANRYRFLRTQTPRHEVRYWTGSWWDTLTDGGLDESIDNCLSVLDG